MNESQPTFLSGIIEGFYGRQWSFEARSRYAEYLSDLGLNTYIYCPKADPYLRKCWHQLWPKDEASALAQVAATYRRSKLHWGVGLSPFALYQNYSATQRQQLRDK